MRGDHRHTHMLACKAWSVNTKTNHTHAHIHGTVRGAALDSASKMSVPLASFDHELGSVIFHAVYLAVKR